MQEKSGPWSTQWIVGGEGDHRTLARLVKWGREAAGERREPKVAE